MLPNILLKINRNCLKNKYFLISSIISCERINFINNKNVRTKSTIISKNNAQFLCPPPLTSFLITQSYCESCVQNEGDGIATYEEVKDLGNHPEKLLIDVRDPEELQETGQIPHSINIPLGDVVKYLSFETPNDKFLKKFEREKPSNKTPIIFYCKIGKRCQDATNIARQLGFQNAKYYQGSWLDWAEREGIKSKE